jgi:hypothetical protein
MTRPQLNILLSDEIIAVNQDPLGSPGDLIWKQSTNEVTDLHWAAMKYPDAVADQGQRFALSVGDDGHCAHAP